MLLGDHQWDTGKSRTEAVKAYTAALIPASELGLEVMVQVGMHAVHRLLSLEAGQRLAHIDRSEKSLRAWLAQQTNTAEASASVAVALWPLRVARRITLASSGGRSLSERALTEILREEIFDAATRTD
jgi:hypothetical protein